jgi:hypothetical protein
MRLRTPSKNKINHYNIVNKSDKEFESIYLLNSLLENIILDSLLENIKIKIEKIKDTIIYEILETKQNPKEYRRTLKRNKQKINLRTKK